MEEEAESGVTVAEVVEEEKEEAIVGRGSKPSADGVGGAEGVEMDAGVDEVEGTPLPLGPIL